jgi:HipA-like C-terminal domain
MFELRPHLLGGVQRSGDLIEALGISRGTLLYAYEREARHVLRLGRARATRYAARQNLPGLDTDEFPVFRVDEAGNIRPDGQLVTLAATESVWLPEETVIDGLPPEMHDVAPKGFLGRSYARHHADLGLPEDVTNWSDNHILIALTRRGEDLPGNLVIGRESFDRFQQLQHEVHTPDDFPRLSADAIAGEHVGSSAGGEQPKFTAFVDGQHRIVKFATDATDNARRWRDLLALEHVALETLRDAGIDAATTELVDLDGLRCLIVDRFDRIGEIGRRAVVTLAAASERVYGTWTDSAEEMHRRDGLGAGSLRQIALLDAYGALIANSDRHHYNVSMFPTQNGYDVAPAFDQLPMAYAPPASGNLINAAISRPRAAVNTLDVWDEARGLADDFWHRAAQQELTGSMQRIVRTHSRR